MTNTARIGRTSSNGLLLAVQSFACQEYGWSLEYTNQTSLVSLLLLMRQKQAMEGNSGFTLEDQEAIENADWETLLKQNRQNLMKSGT